MKELHKSSCEQSQKLTEEVEKLSGKEEQRMKFNFTSNELENLIHMENDFFLNAPVGEAQVFCLGVKERPRKLRKFDHVFKIVDPICEELIGYTCYNVLKKKFYYFEEEYNKIRLLYSTSFQEELRNLYEEKELLSSNNIRTFWYE